MNSCRSVRTFGPFRRGTRALVVGALSSLLTSFTALADSIPKAPANICIESSANCGPSRAPAPTAKKWHPGHYMGVLRADTSQAIRFGYYDQIRDNTTLLGVEVMFRWNQLEGSTPGDYAAGIALVRAEVNKLKSLTKSNGDPNPKRLIIGVMDTGLKPSCPSSTPAYIHAQGLDVVANNLCIVRRWNATATGYWIKMLNAYAAAFDNEPYVEMIRPYQDMAASTGASPPADFSMSALDAQYRHVALALSQSWKKTNIYFPLSFHPTNMSSFMSYISSLGIGAGGPDTVPGSTAPITRVLLGTTGGHDYRGEIPVVMQVEVSELGYNSVGVPGGYTAQQVYDYIDGTMRVGHMIWDRNTVIGNADQRWDGANGLLAVLSANPISHTSCPTQYEALAGGCNPK